MLNVQTAQFSLCETAFAVFHLFLSVFYFRVRQHDTCSFLCKPCNGNAEVCIVIHFPFSHSVSGVLNSHKFLARGAPWRHRTKSMSTYPLGGVFSHHQTHTLLFAQLGLSQTHFIFLLLFTNTAALTHCKTWWGSFLSQAIMDDHCIFPAWRNVFDCQL